MEHNIQDVFIAIQEKKAELKDLKSVCKQIQDLKIDIESDQEMLNDIAMLKYTKGEPIEIKDKYDNEYEPVFSVKFKKSN